MKLRVSSGKIESIEIRWQASVVDRAERHEGGTVRLKEVEVVFVIEGKCLIARYSDANLFSRLAKHWKSFKFHLQSTFQIHKKGNVQVLNRKVGKSIDQATKPFAGLAFFRRLQPEVSLRDRNCGLSGQPTEDWSLTGRFDRSFQHANV